MDDNFDKKLREMAKNSSIKEPFDIRELTKNTYKSNKKINKFFKYTKFIVAASVLIICTSILGIFINANAEEIPIINKVLEYFTRYNKVDNGYNGNTVEENYSVHEDKYTVNIEDVYFDGIKLVLFYKIESSEALDKSSIYYLDTTLEINANIDALGGLEEREFIDDYTYYGMISYGINSNSSDIWPEIINGTININSIDIYKKGISDVETIEINNEPLKVNIDSKNVIKKEIPINKVISYNGLETEFTRLIKSPIGLTMDTLHNETWYSDKGVYFLTYLWDSKKGLLKFEGKTNDINDRGIVISEQYENPSIDGDLSIISFVSESGPMGDGEDRSIYYNLEEGAALDLGDLGKLKVESIIDKDNNTIITMRTTGFVSVDYIQIINGDQKFMDAEITNKEVYGELDMKASYVFPKLNRESGIYLKLYHPRLLELLSDQTIRVNLSNLR